jgi:penicillin amidase
MNGRLIKNTTATIFSLIVCLLAFIFFAIFLVTRTSVDEDSSLEVEKVLDSVKIYRNKFSIPHIIARNEHDVFFAMGYVHAQDRLWQMDIARRAGKGRLSAIFGPEAVNADKFMRAMNLASLSNKLYKSSSKTTRFILDSYTQGVNYFLEEHHDKLPFEFGALSYEPEIWTPQDCLIILRLMGMELSMSMWSDLAFGELSDKLGINEALQLVPSYPIQAPAMLGGEASNQQQASLSKNQNSSGINLAMLCDLKGLRQARKFLDIRADGIGSNAWVMKKNQAGSGTQIPILANDPHLKLGLPARWYQTHITAPAFNAIGVTIPGLPLIVSGRNDRIAWGFTSLMADDFDYFIEKTDTSNTNYYFNAAGKRVKFRYRRDTIIVKNADTIIYDLRFTERSAVISDASPARLMLPEINEKKTLSGRYCLSFEWTGQQMSDEVLAMYRMMKADNWNEFQQGLNIWGVPALNVLYGDKKGIIAAAAIGTIPQRGPKANPNIPSPGWLAEYAWQAAHRSNELPRMALQPGNGTRRYFASANNPPSKNLPFYITNLWEPASRAERLHQALAQFDEYDVRDAQFLQMDIQSPFASEIMQLILPVLQSKKKYMPAEAQKALEKISLWKNVMTAQDAEPAIFALFMDNLIRSVFADQMQPEIFAEYCFVANIPNRKIHEMLISQDTLWNKWFDDVRTQGSREDKNEMIYRSFVRAVRQGITLFESNDPLQWKYGKMHTVTLRHLFSTNPLMRPIVTHGPFAVGGSLHTLNNGAWSVNEPFEQQLGASMRIISDLEDSVVYTVLPGGTSGEPLSSHYSDQVQIWLNGGYVRMPTGRQPGDDFRLYTLLLPDND